MVINLVKYVNLLKQFCASSHRGYQGKSGKSIKFLLIEFLFFLCMVSLNVHKEQKVKTQWLYCTRVRSNLEYVNVIWGPFYAMIRKAVKSAGQIILRSTAGIRSS